MTEDKNKPEWNNLQAIKSDFSINDINFPSLKMNWSEANSLICAKGFLTIVTNEFNLGKVTLILEDEESCLPIFNIKAPKSLSADGRIELFDKIFDGLYNHYDKSNRLDELKRFFFRLNFEE